MASPDVLSEFGRNLQTGVSAAFTNFTRHSIDALHLPNHTKGLRVDKTVDELPALHRAVFVENNQRHVFHVRVERVTERDHLYQWREKHEEQSHRIAPD